MLKYLDMYIQDKKKNRSHGWLRSLLFDLSLRWRWWSLCLWHNQIIGNSIPQINFVDQTTESSPQYKMIKKCASEFYHEGIGFEQFIDWLLFGFGDSGVRVLPDKIQPKHTDYWFKTFDPSLLIGVPGDWAGHFYEVDVVAKWTKERQGFFSTPMSVCKMMVQMQMTGSNPRTRLTASVMDPCVGTGRMLMAASNHSVNLYGVDINPVCCKITRLNGWLYMPSLVMPMKGIRDGDNIIRLDESKPAPASTKNLRCYGNAVVSGKGQFGVAG